jgi:Protein of unknown function (DUF1553)/Protein of unknown function (DUF1549)/Concanavalin A-like lectin/glucanases superfamily/Planctomycete cytochrome C
MGHRSAIVAALLALTAAGVKAGSTDAHAKPVDFDREIRPILSDRCFACHGPDQKQKMANLRLDIKDGGAYSTRGSYQLVVPGDAAKSRLYQRIASTSANRMPPVAAGPSLTAVQVQLIKRWIDEGAKWEVHWAYVAPQSPALPEVKDKKWARNPIDRFVLARLEREGLKPSHEAPKATLLRRLSLDITGLPPTAAELDAFLADRSPDAYEKQVDRLLNSPRYGERMAMQWLDLARYADTHGYHIDSHRDMWHWRDWVIGAFNRNMPYSQFVVDQLAGDLLPNATIDQKIASGFNRNHMINFEGGAIAEEYQNEYVVDRVETTSVAFLGMTMGCARCHDHKYDPISQKDFYRFYAFFNTIPEKGLDGRRGNAEPVVRIPTPEQAREDERVKRELAQTQQALSEDEIAKLQAEWAKNAEFASKLPPAAGLAAHYEFDGGLADSSAHSEAARIVKGDVTYPAGYVNRAVDLGGETQLDFGPIGDFDRSDPFTIAVWVRGNGILETDVLHKLSDPQTRRGFELVLGDAIPIGDLRRGAQLSFRLVHRWPDDAIEIRTKARLPLSSKDEGIPKPWYHVVLAYDGSGKASGLRLWLNGKLEPVDVLKDHLTGPIRNTAPLAIGDAAVSKPYKGQLDDLRLYTRTLDAAEIQQLALTQPARATLSLPEAKRSKEQKDRLRDYFLTYEAPETYLQLYADVKRLKAEQQFLQETIPTSMVMLESDKPRETAVLGRGDYRNRGEKVTAGVPAVLPPLAKDAPLNRLTLAQWLVDPAHPLTARVAVNHFWQMYLGTGLVKTAEDFGSQGEPPSHPELLDWLAVNFVQTGWDVKAMQKLIVTSATYRQSSRVTPALHEQDPENRLLARGPRLRLPAEMIRDNALAVSGLLYEKVGGPSVYPYQPAGLWEETSYGDVYSAQSYAPGSGKDLYRRSMYSFWKRTSPPPSLITFDAPDREKCTARRSATNTPLQALVLMNDPTYVEASRRLAQRMLTEAGTDPKQRINFAFRLVTARAATSQELKILRELAEAQTAEYRAQPKAAEQILRVGESSADPKLNATELAAWTMVASAILNLDEAITKE